MRLTCPLCGERDRREFTCLGADTYLRRPAPDAEPAAWDDYLHLRDNPAGATRDLWYHDPCGAWLAVSRDTLSHAVRAVVLIDPPPAVPDAAAPPPAGRRAPAGRKPPAAPAPDAARTDAGEAMPDAAAAPGDEPPPEAPKRRRRTE
jgi:sarcosine oxidase subunit delta